MQNPASKIVTQYIKYSNPENEKIEDLINENLISLFKDVYSLTDNFDLKEYNKADKAETDKEDETKTTTN